MFVQVASPSRERVQQYREVRDDIERWVGRINGDLGTIGHPPVHYLHASFPREEMAALYRAADVMVVTPFADGMNLVAKEYVTCGSGTTGRWCCRSSPERPTSSSRRSWSTRTTSTA